MKNKLIPIVLALIVLPASHLIADNISFSGGYTKVTMQDEISMVELSGGAHVSTETLNINADKITLSGKNYSNVRCSGNVVLNDRERGLNVKTLNLNYNRTDETIISDGWIEIEDTGNEARLSGSWFEYNKETSVMILQMRASIEKKTDSGLLECHADSISYNSDKQILELKGNAVVVWENNTYNASYININIETKEISLQGSISGEING